MPHVIVVGGGFAGLAAAKTLEASQNVSVTLLEASDDFGGRARSIQLPDGQKAELGATWLHGIRGHPVYDLAVQYGLMSTDPVKGTNFWKGAQFAREGEKKTLNGPEAKLVSSILSEFAEAVDRSEESDAASVGHYLQSQFDETSKEYEQGSREAEIVKDAWAWRELLQRGIDGYDTTDDGSTAGLAEYEDLPGPWPPVTGGYQNVARRIAKDLNNVRLNTEVTEIDWSNPSVRVRCKDGSLFEANAVICTVSLGVLKERHSSLFRPELPDSKIDAIRRLGIGVVDKIFVTFDGLSKDASRRYEFLWRSGNDQAVPGAERRGGSAIESCFSGQETATQNGSESRHPDEEWHRGLYSLRLGGAEFIEQQSEKSSSSRKSPKQSELETDLPHVENARDSSSESDSDIEETSERRANGQTGVLWITGHHAVAMEHCDAEGLRNGLNSVFDAFPALAIPRNFQVSRSQWGLNPFTRGSYSYVAANASVDDVGVLHEPLCDSDGSPVVCFAGEATDLKHIGTTSGAFFSGQREANRLLAAFEARGHAQSVRATA